MKRSPYLIYQRKTFHKMLLKRHVFIHKGFVHARDGSEVIFGNEIETSITYCIRDGKCLGNSCMMKGGGHGRTSISKKYMFKGYKYGFHDERWQSTDMKTYTIDVIERSYCLNNMKHGSYIIYRDGKIHKKGYKYNYILPQKQECIVS